MRERSLYIEIKSVVKEKGLCDDRFDKLPGLIECKSAYVWCYIWDDGCALIEEFNNVIMSLENDRTTTVELLL